MFISNRNISVQKSTKMTNNGANLGFEKKLWAAADKMRSNMDAAEYKHVVLGLIFLKYISDSFTELHEKLKKDKLSDPEDMDEYVSRTIFWVPKEARWEHLQENASKSRKSSKNTTTHRTSRRKPRKQYLSRQN